MTIRIYKTIQELASIRGIWENLQNSSNSDFDHFQLVCKMRKEVLNPYICVIEQNGNPCALIVGRIEQIRFNPAIGYFKFPGIPATVLIIIYRGIIGRLDEDTAEEFTRHLSSLLTEGEFDSIILYYLSEDSLLLKKLYTHNLITAKQELPWSVHWEMEIEKEQGFLLKKLKAKHRSWITGREKKLNSEFPGLISWVWLNHFENLPDLCDRIEEVASRTYQRALKSGFSNNEMYRQRLALFANSGMLRIQLLEIDGKIKAFWIGILNDGVFHSSETGYDPDLKNYEIGTLIFVHMVDELVREGAHKLDFGFGDALYKQRFGNKSWREATIQLYSKSAKGLIIQKTLGIFSFFDRAARQLIQRMKLYDKIKTWWRITKASSLQGNAKE